MNCTNFIKVSKTMTWNELKKIIINTNNIKATPLQYAIVTTIDVSAENFDIISESIYNSYQFYMNYTLLSTPTPKGVWNCILIQCAENSKNLLIYTGGRVYPLYASILHI